MTGDRWQVTGDRWQVTGDRWQVTGDRWQVTGDTWHMTRGLGWTFSQKISSLALPAWDWQCFEYISTNLDLKQCSDVWAISRSKPTFLWNAPFELIFHARLSKTNRFSSFRAKSLRKKNLGQNLDFCKSYFLWPLWNWGFGTNMESNAAVTLHFEDLAVKNYLFLKYVCIRLWKISNCSFKYFW